MCDASTSFDRTSLYGTEQNKTSNRAKDLSTLYVKSNFESLPNEYSHM